MSDEQTYIMIKPDGVQRGIVGEIISRFEQKGFHLLGLKMMSPSREHLEKHYADLAGKKFFPGLIDYMCSGPVVCMVWEGMGAVATGRVMLGATKPSDSAPGTIRGDYCIHVGRNICHGSDSVESAQHEIALWFPEGLNKWEDHSKPWIYEGADAPKKAAAGVPLPWKLDFSKKLTEKQIACFDDDRVLNSKAPSITAKATNLTYLKGDGPEYGKKPVAVFFWGKYAKGDWRTIVAFSQLQKAYPQIEVVGISLDGKIDDAKKLLSKCGQEFAELNIKLMEADCTLAWDDGKSVSFAFQNMSSTRPMGPGACYLINTEGRVVWKDSYTQTWAVSQGLFAEQVDLLVNGKPLIKVGDTPPEDEDEEEECAGAGVDMDAFGDGDGSDY